MRLMRKSDGPVIGQEAACDSLSQSARTASTELRFRYAIVDFPGREAKPPSVLSANSKQTRRTDECEGERIGQRSNEHYWNTYVVGALVLPCSH